MKHTGLIIAVMLLAGLGYAAYAYYEPAEATARDATVAPEAEPIKAEILNADPSNFTIDVEFWSNWNANSEAEYFAVYVSDDKPANCVDFHTVDLSYDKPEQYKRRFDLSGHEDILKAIETHKCVIIPNIPS